MKVYLAYQDNYPDNATILLGVFRTKAGAWGMISNLERYVYDYFKGYAEDYLDAYGAREALAPTRFMAFVGDLCIGEYPTEEAAQAALDAYDYRDFAVKPMEVQP